jgi:hypothetical protein
MTPESLLRALAAHAAAVNPLTDNLGMDAKTYYAVISFLASDDPSVELLAPLRPEDLSACPRRVSETISDRP